MERADDVKSIITTYEGHHNHDIPLPKSTNNALSSPRISNALPLPPPPLAIILPETSAIELYPDKEAKGDHPPTPPPPLLNKTVVTGSSALV